jgi:hypothetical protein
MKLIFDSGKPQYWKKNAWLTEQNVQTAQNSG